MKHHIAFIGLGRMGQAMATNLLLAGHTLTVYNRSPDKAEAMRARGASVADTPADAVREAEVVFTMVTDDEVLRELTTGDDGILAGLPPDAVHASCSTVAPATNQELAMMHREHGSWLVAAPVFGRPIVAANGQLWVCLAGPNKAKSRLLPLLPSFSQGNFDLGEDPGAANVLKLCGNFMLGAAIEAMAEAFTLAEKSGLDRMVVFEFLTTALFNSPAYRTYGRMVAEEDYQPAGTAPSLLEKDLKLTLAEARAHQVPMPVANIILDHLTATVTRHSSADEDWTSFARRISESAGLIR
ncbi:NAD(P)-dependent oxidoreductase [Hymenobacter jeollabukensis]|uniref:NAD(P)-dependent oxidoreductase n=1 Tax=Hymenobacter jeollabukensis TaxID=2025313 RepID=A0A5R8WX99_9BACT|nr:NAD(P)-dependent oxidoreductase [Hymenobacter jeollabukensis]TLM96683.1 NAD(P)-dependent oxidoreductase [Hymenobacter jeollabukensis]